MTAKQRFRNNKYRLEVRERDHGPAHVHLVGGGFDVIIAWALWKLMANGRAACAVKCWRGSRHITMN